MGPGGKPSEPWIAELSDQRYFPLKAIELDASGKQTSSMEVTKIEKKSVDEALFAPPAGYHAMTIPSFGGGGMPGMPPGMPTPPHGAPHH